MLSEGKSDGGKEAVDSSRGPHLIVLGTCALAGQHFRYNTQRSTQSHLPLLDCPLSFLVRVSWRLADMIELLTLALYHSSESCLICLHPHRLERFAYFPPHLLPALLSFSTPLPQSHISLSPCPGCNDFASKNPVRTRTLRAIPKCLLRS